MSTITMSKPIMNRQEVADFLGVNIRTVDNLTARNQIPYSRVPSIKENGRGRIVFVKDNILKWLTQNEVTPVEKI
tara:strand:- start:396 stop:620 length:225 start_codon:yes stop_codon:yes gene_type:complete